MIGISTLKYSFYIIANTINNRLSMYLTVLYNIITMCVSQTIVSIDIP